MWHICVAMATVKAANKKDRLVFSVDIWLRRSSVLQLDSTCISYRTVQAKSETKTPSGRKKRGKLNSNQFNFKHREKAIKCIFVHFRVGLRAHEPMMTWLRHFLRKSQSAVIRCCCFGIRLFLCLCGSFHFISQCSLLTWNVHRCANISFSNNKRIEDRKIMKIR